MKFICKFSGMPASALILCFSLGYLPVYSQISLKMEVNAAEAPAFKANLQDFTAKKITDDSGAVVFALKSATQVDSLCLRLQKHFLQKAYLTASIDTLQKVNDSLYLAFLHLGPAMRWLRFQPADETSASWLSAVRVKEDQIEGKAVYYQALLKLENSLLTEAENNGYPFASVRLDSLNIDSSGGVSALLRVDPKRFFSFKGLKINGDLKLPRYFLPNYLGLRPGTPYSRARVLRLRDQLNTLLFLESTANPTVTFSGSEATVNLFLQKKRASRFDFIIGILPQPDARDGRLLLTGNISAAFQNALSLGERFSIELERLKPETQKLDVQGAVPYLFGTPFGADGRLNIFKRDSTWVDAQGEIGVQYLLAGGNFLRIFWENKSAALQKIDTATIKSSHQLPPNLDFRQNSFGLELAFSKLDYRFNPRKGWLLSVKGQAGFNEVQRNTIIEGLRDPAQPEFRFATLYDSLAGKSGRFKLECRVETYVPLFSRTAIKLALRAAGIYSDKPVFANEQYRLGGNKLLRGFNEELFQATRYAVGTAEWRLLAGRNSYLAAFADWGYLENLTDRNRYFLRPFGLGAGLNFETKAGIFGISVAVGRQDTGQAIDFKAPKFHLGYVSLL